MTGAPIKLNHVLHASIPRNNTATPCVFKVRVNFSHKPQYSPLLWTISSKSLPKAVLCSLWMSSLPTEKPEQANWLLKLQETAPPSNISQSSEDIDADSDMQRTRNRHDEACNLVGQSMHANRTTTSDRNGSKG